MATIHRTLDLSGTAEGAWNKLRAVGGVENLLPMIADSRVEGDSRYCSIADGGGQLSELILGNDDELRRIAYSIVEGPFPMSFHAASMQVVERGDQVQLIWVTDVKPDALAPELAKVIDSQLSAFAANLSS